MVYKDNGTCLEFKHGKKDLYYSVYSVNSETVLMNEYHSDEGVNTVNENLTRFTQRQISDAETARRFQNTAGLATKCV